MLKLPKIVAVTGACGYIGTCLLLQLETNLDMGKIVAFDRKPLPFPIHNIAFYQGVLQVGQGPGKGTRIQLKTSGTSTSRTAKESAEKEREEEEEKGTPLEEILVQHQVETLVHLASAYSHTSTRQDWVAETREELSILESILESCRKSGIKHAIFLSSHTVYGAFADNPIPFSETSPIRSRSGDSLGEASVLDDLALQEFRKSELEKEGKGIKVTILRTCQVLGYSDDHQRAEHIFPDRFLGAGEDPPFQFLHEVDMVRVLEEVIQQEADGIFNVAGEGVVFLGELADTTRRKLTRFPLFLANAADWLSAKKGEPGSGNWNLHTTRYPIIMNTGKIKQTLNYRFGYSSMEALNAFVNYNGL